MFSVLRQRYHDGSLEPTRDDTHLRGKKEQTGEAEGVIGVGMK
jgi:hypothetical protein